MRSWIITVCTVVDVVHDVAFTVLVHDALGDDVGDNRAGRSDVVATGFRDDLHTAVLGEVLVEGSIEDGGDVLEADLGAIVAREAASDVQVGEFKAESGSYGSENRKMEQYPGRRRDGRTQLHRGMLRDFGSRFQRGSSHQRH